MDTSTDNKDYSGGEILFIVLCSMFIASFVFGIVLLIWQPKDYYPIMKGVLGGASVTAIGSFVARYAMANNKAGHFKLVTVLALAMGLFVISALSVALLNRYGSKPVCQIPPPCTPAPCPINTMNLIRYDVTDGNKMHIDEFFIPDRDGEVTFTTPIRTGNPDNASPTAVFTVWRKKGDISFFYFIQEPTHAFYACLKGKIALSADGSISATGQIDNDPHGINGDQINWTGRVHVAG